MKDIDKKRFEELFVIEAKDKDDDIKTKLIQSDKTTRFLGIDQFKFHNGRKYATYIINMKIGHIISIAGSKKKQVICDFIVYVGPG